MVPAWGLGVKYRGKSDFSDTKALNLANYFRKNNIPCDMFGLEPGWQTVNRRAGYSLLEVLIAFAIMAMVLAVLVPGQVGLLRRTADAGSALLAADFAASRIDAFGVTEPVHTGRKETAYRDWVVLEEVSYKDVASGAPQVYQIAVEVQTKAGRSLARLESLRSFK